MTDMVVNKIHEGGRTRPPLIMGVVNVTPDSFSDGGRFFDPASAIAHGKALIHDGADILDIGGESTRPGAMPVSIDDEIARVVPVINGLRDAGAALSIDTRNAAVMTAALDAGASIINDVSALTHDRAAMDVAAASDVPVVLMHAQGTPQTMQADPRYDDVVNEVRDYLARRVEACAAHGIASDRLIVDPGIGFGKTPEHNLALLRNLSAFSDLGCQVLLGASRKRFIEAIHNGAGADQRVAGSLAAIDAALDAGVGIVRVHDVFETRQYISVRMAIAGDAKQS